MNEPMSIFIYFALHLWWFDGRATLWVTLFIVLFGQWFFAVDESLAVTDNTSVVVKKKQSGIFLTEGRC